MSNYYNDPVEFPRESNRVVRFHVAETPPHLTSANHYKVPSAKMDPSKLIPWVTSVCGIGLIIIGLSYYVFHLVQFLSAVGGYSDQNGTEGLKRSWDFLFLMVTINLTSEVIVVVMSSIFCAMLYNSAFNCSKVKQLSETTRKILKSMTLLFLGVLTCYVQTVVGFLRLSTLIKINLWLTENNCDCRSETTP